MPGRNDEPVPAEAGEKIVVNDSSRAADVESRTDESTVAGEGEQPMDDDKSASIDGGLTAWLVVLGAWCCSFCSNGWIQSVGVFQQYYEDHPLKEYSSSQIAWISGLQIFFISFLGPVVGVLFDRYGPQKLLMVGSFMHVFGLMMASISAKYYQFLLSQGVCSAMGVAAVYMAAIGSVSGWFERNRGLAFGVLATGSSFGGVVLPIMVTRLIRDVSYGWAMRTCAFLMGGLLVVAIFTLRRRSGIPPQTRFTVKEMKAPFKETSFLFLLLGLCLIPFGLYTPIDYLPIVATDAGMNASLAQYLISIYNGASLIGRLSSGALSDRLGRFNIFIVSCYVAGLLVMAMWVPSKQNSITIAFSAMFGLFSGAYIALLAALIAQISPIEEIGYRNGIACLAQSVGGLASTPIAGAIIAKPNGHLGIKIYAGAFLLAGTTSILIARLIKTRFKLNVVT